MSPVKTHRTAVLVLAIAAGSAVGDAPASARKVVIEAMRFTPQTLTVHRGETVTWENRDPFPHTVTAPGSFDSKSIAPGASWTFTPKKSGDYAYQCSLHPTMKGQLSVQ